MEPRAPDSCSVHDSRARACVSDWPGLGQSALYEGRDLKPTLDTRAVLKAALAGTFDLTAPQLERIFPNSAAVSASRGIDGLTRSRAGVHHGRPEPDRF